MKRFLLFALCPIAIIILVACNSRDAQTTNEDCEELFSLVLNGEDSIVSGKINELGFALFKEMQATNQGHSFVFSPLCASTALAMLANGASGETLQEIERLIGSSKTANAFFHKYLQAMPHTQDYLLEMNGLIAVNQSNPLSGNFVELLKNDFQAVARNYNFNDSRTADAINNWISGLTEGRISNVISEIDNQEIALLISLLRIKSPWAVPFCETMTFVDNGHFVSESGDTIVHPMMFQEIPAYMMENEEFQALVKEFKMKHFSMLFVLPKNKTLNECLSMFNVQTFYETVESLRFEEDVQIEIPRYSTESEKNFSEMLRKLLPNAMGMKSNYARMSSVPSRVEKIIQKTRIDVAEGGVDAASTTLEETWYLSISPSFIADHPFLYFIYDDISRTILFMGQYCGN